jgi:MarC family membrane protein
MHQSFSSVVAILLLVMDPFANIPAVVALLAGVPAARRLPLIARECGFAAAILLLFLVGGSSMLRLLGLSTPSVDIAGGVVLLLIAVRMIFKDPAGVFGAEPQGEPFIVPLATPLIAGPAAIGTVLLLASREPGHPFELAAAILLATAATFLVLAAAARIARRLGDHVLAAIERLMGLVLAAIAVEMFLRGLSVYLRGLPR